MYLFVLQNEVRNVGYMYLGKGGSEAHINAVEKMTRRNLIDELERVFHFLQ